MKQQAIHRIIEEMAFRGHWNWVHHRLRQEVQRIKQAKEDEVDALISATEPFANMLGDDRDALINAWEAEKVRRVKVEEAWAGKCYEPQKPKRIEETAVDAGR